MANNAAEHRRIGAWHNSLGGGPVRGKQDDKVWTFIAGVIFGLFLSMLISLSLSPAGAASLDCAGKYDRKCYPHWIDEDGDGQHTREEMLEAQSLVPVEKNGKGKITAGLWVSPYDGKVHRDPGKLDLDHVISLGHIHRIGGRDMTPDQRKAIANDPDNLILVTAASNRSKSDHSGVRWVIPNLAYLGEFLKIQERVRNKYSLGYEPCEQRAIWVQEMIAQRTEKGLRMYRAADLIAAHGSRTESVDILTTYYHAWTQCLEGKG